MLLIKGRRSRAEIQSLQPLTDKVTTPYHRNILERNIKLRKDKPRFAQEVHLPRATLVVPHEAFVRQEIQTILVSSDPMVVTGFPVRPAGVGEWLPPPSPIPTYSQREDPRHRAKLHLFGCPFKEIMRRFKDLYTRQRSRRVQQRVPRQSIIVKFVFKH